MEYYDIIPAYYAKQHNKKEYVKDIIKQHWNNGLRLVICDLKDQKNDRMFGLDLIKCIREDNSFIAPNSPGFFNKEIPIIAYTGAVVMDEKEVCKFASEIVYKVTKNPKANDKEKQNYKEHISKLENTIQTWINKFDIDLYTVNPWLKEIEIFKATNSAFINGFVMMPFSDENKKTVDYLNDCLKEHNIKLHIANASGGKNKGSLWPDIEVFMNACDFGIAIYTDDSKRKKENKINPNVTIETGYMLGLQKMVYICKHEELEKFNEEYSDLKHAIYISFSDKDTLLNGLKEKLKNEGYIIQQK